jgi:2-haloacid dehalogenase
MNSDVRTVFESDKTTTLSFDCYGTLIDWESGACGAFRRIYGYPRSEVTDDTLIDLFLCTDARIIRENIFPYAKVLQCVGESVAKSLGVRSNPRMEALFARSLPTWPVFEETNRSLACLARHYRLAIISNVDDDLLALTIEQFGVPFDITVTSQQTSSYKPDRRIFEQAVKLIGDHPSRIIHIAEGLCEAMPARALGMRSIWVNRSARSDDGSNAKPNAVVSVSHAWLCPHHRKSGSTPPQRVDFR